MIHNRPTDAVFRTLQNLGNVFQDFVALADDAGTLVYLNRSGRELTGMADDANVYRHTLQTLFSHWSVNDLLSSSHVNEAGAGRSAILSMNREATLSTVDGRSIPTLLSVHAHLSEDSKIEFFLIVARDISGLKSIEHDRVIMEKRLLDACRVEAIGRLTLGVMDNLEHSLFQIADYSATALRRMDDTSDARSPLERAIKLVDVVRLTVRRIIEAVAPAPDTGTPVRIKDVVREVVSMARTSLPGTIVVRQHIDDVCDPVALGRLPVQELL